MATDEERDRLRLAKIAHLEGLIGDIDGDWQKVPRLGYAAVLCVPVGIVTRSFVWALVEVVAVACLIGVVYYILGIRRDEYAQECTEMRRGLSTASRPPAR